MLLTIVVLNALFTTIKCSSFIERLDPKEIYDEAYAVVKGTVIDVRTTGGEGFSYIYAEIKVDWYLKNPRDPSRTICIIAYKIEPHEGVNDTSAPLVDFEEGEKVVVFLEYTSEGCYSLVGGSQGKFTLKVGSYVNYLGERMYKPQQYYLFLMISSSVVSTIIVFLYWRRKVTP
jgi:hypothetical protein